MQKIIARRPQVNNDYYHQLGNHWYESDDDPIAVLRAEQKAKNPWIKSKIKTHFTDHQIKIADIGCGAGFLTNDLINDFEEVYGLDASQSSLDIGRLQDKSKKVHYIHGDAYQLPFEDCSMDVVCSMDFLEHVENPEKVVQECSRILKPGGIFFFHTFNRNFLSWLIVIKFMEWFLPKTPRHLHVHHLFIKPKELQRMMLNHKLEQKELVGISPKINLGFFRSLFYRRVLPDFCFNIKKSVALGYMGYAHKKVIVP